MFHCRECHVSLMQFCDVVYHYTTQVFVVTIVSSLAGAREAAFRNIKSIAECLADELINAAKVGLH